MSHKRFDFYFVRHGETNWGREDILKGPQDLELNSNGIQQAKRAATLLKKELDKIVDVKVVTSSLKRAVQTAQHISETMGIETYYQEDGLKERYYGDYRLCTNAECDRTGHFNVIPPDAETNDVFQKRVTDTFDEIFSKYSCPLIVVSHQKVFEWLSESLTKRKERLIQGGIGHFTVRSDDPTCWKLEIQELDDGVT